MRRLVLLAAGLAAPVAALAQPLERATYRVSERDTSYLAPVCARLPDGLTACRTYLPSEDETDGADRLRFTVAKGADERARWETTGGSAMSEGFDLLRTDLDGDGAREIIVAHHEATGNGLGVRFWVLFVLAEAGTDVPPLTFTTVEYGAAGTFPRVGGRRAVLATDFMGGTEPGRGEGLYFTGRLYRYAAGALVPDPLPIRQRRYLNSFAREREGSFDPGTPNPWRWLSRGYRTLPTDPGLSGRPTAEATGHVRSVVQTDSGRVVTFAPDVGAPVATRNVRFGDAPTRRLFPDGYAPAGGEAALAGRRGRLATYPDDYEGGDPPRVVWLDR